MNKFNLQVFNKFLLFPFFFVFIQIFGHVVFGQGSPLTANHINAEKVKRMEIKYGNLPPFFSNLQPFNKGDIIKYVLKLDSIHFNATDFEKYEFEYLYKDNNEWLSQNDLPTTLGGKSETINTQVYVDSTNTFYSLETNPNFASINSTKYFTSKKPFLKYFYKTPSNFFEYNSDFFFLRVNPIVNLNIHHDSNSKQPVFQNTRGLVLRGGLDDRIYFFTELLENQARVPFQASTYKSNTGALPGIGFFKPYNSEIFNIENGYDYTLAKAILSFNITKHLGVQFGHGTNFIGDGYRSLFLSDFATNYFHLKLNWRVGNFQLQNIFGEASATNDRQLFNNDVAPKKYFAAHYFGFRLFEKMRIGLFETVVFKRDEGFELQYLNPIILYRTVETLVGASPDNVLLGFDMKYNFAKGFQFYSQVILDEFKFDELILERNGWWGNKYGIQAGIKAADLFGLNKLDVQLEYNVIRPYTYSHHDSIPANYAHYNQELAHPLGANFNEVIAILIYRPINKLNIELRYFNINQGLDGVGENFGSNIRLSNRMREMEYDNEIGQGIETNTQIFSVNLSYMLFQNCFIDFDYNYRNSESKDHSILQNNQLIGGGIRLNINRNRFDY